MAQNPAKHRFPWTPEEIKSLEELLEQKKEVRVIAITLGRTESAVKTKIKEIKLIKKKREQVVIESETVIAEYHEPEKPKEGFLKRLLNRSTSSTGAEAGVDEGETAEDEDEVISEEVSIAWSEHGKSSDAGEGIGEYSRGGDQGGGEAAMNRAASIFDALNV